MLKQLLTFTIFHANISPPPADRAVRLSLVAAESSAQELHERYLDSVYSYVARRVPRREEAEDITAEVFVAALTSLPKRRGNAFASPYPYLLGIARRKISDAHRRRQRGRWRELLSSEVSSHRDDSEDLFAVLQAPYPSGPEASALRAERQKAIRSLVAGLKEEQREALLLHYVEELSLNDVAQVMGKSPAAVNSLLQRARQTLYARGQSYFLPPSPEIGQESIAK
jgi:RNA polymerase sigma-70 factor (ECF subfamily)